MGGSAKVLAVLAATATVMVAVPTGQAAFPGQNGKIAFLNSPSLTSTTMHVVNADGSARANISNVDPPFSDWDPAWSPDGTKLVFISNRDSSSFELYTMNADGSDVKRITNNSRLEVSPSWSADGTKIVYFGRCIDGTGGFCVMNADGSGGTRIPNTSGRDENPAWSPDGRKIAFSRRGESGVSNIYTMNPDGSDAAPLTFLPDCAPSEDQPTSCSYARNPDWSPDGTKIAFYITTAHCGVTCEYQADINVINRDGTGLVSLTRAPPNVVNVDPAWSPDGNWIVFARGPGCELCAVSDLYIMSPSGSNVTVLAEDPEGEGEPDWQPIPGPQRGNYKNAAQFCKAERAFLGNSGSRQKYGGGANAHGKCVSGK